MTNAGAKLAGVVLASALAAWVWGTLSVAQTNGQGPELTGQIVPAENSDQDDPDPERPRVEVVGNERIETQTILDLIELGSDPTPSEVNDVLKALHASGLFSSVEIEIDEGRFIVNVVEEPIVNRVTVSGNDRFRDDIILELLTLGPRRQFNTDALERDRDAIIQFYRDSGSPSVEVDASTIPLSENRVDIEFEITENALGIERVEFTGNRSFDTCTLRRVVTTRQNGSIALSSSEDDSPERVAYRLFGEIIFSTSYAVGWTPPNTADPERLALDRRLLGDFYRQNGFFDVGIGEVSVRTNNDGTDQIVTFHVDEGSLYRFGNPSIAIEIEGLQLDFERALAVTEGEIYDASKIQRTLENMTEDLRDAGISFVEVFPRLDADLETRIVTPVFRVVQGPKRYIERIDIEGNSVTLDRVIRRQFQLAEGDPFNEIGLRRGAEAIRDAGFLEAIEVRSIPGSSSDQIVIRVVVMEKPSGELDLAVEYAMSTGFGVSLSFNEPNLLGRGQLLEAEAKLATGNASAQIMFVEPFFYGQDLPFRLGLEFTTGEAFDPATVLTGLQVSVWLGFVVVRIPVILMVLITGAFYCYVWRADPVRVRLRYLKMLSQARLIILLQCAVVAAGVLSTATLAVAAPLADQVSRLACETVSE